MAMDLCLNGRLFPHTRPFKAQEYKMQWSYKPFVSQRPKTSYTVRDAFSPSPRIHSAQSHISMTATPRSQVSVAGFYDWSASEEQEEISASQIYRKIASLSQKGKFGNTGSKSWCSDGVHVSPGRMFLRDKAELTKGEREIIAGIYKNRSDSSKDNKNTNVTHIKSHRDAWLIGKKIAKRNTQISYQDDSSLKVPDHLFSKLDTPKVSNNIICYMCTKCKEDCLYHRHDHKEREENTEEIKDIHNDKIIESEGRKAPPTTPSHSPKQSRRQTKPSSGDIAEGAIFIEAGKTFYDPEEKSRKKKVFVDVFLPQFPNPSLTEEATSLDIHTGRESKPEQPMVEKILQSRLEKKAKVGDTDAKSDEATVTKLTYVHSGRQHKNSSNNSSRAASSSGE